MPLKASVPAASTGRRDISYKDGYVAQDGTVVAFQPDWTKQHQLEGDGLLSGLYNHLWKSDKTKEHRLKSAWLPDTVLFLHNFPRVWYTYDQKAQEIVKRPGKLLDARSIYEFFCEEEDDCDIVAQFFYQLSGYGASTTTTSSGGTGTGGNVSSSSPGGGGGSNGSPSKKKHGATSANDDDEPSTEVEFFTKEMLFDFLHNRKAKPDGVLQKFVVPKGEDSSRCNFQIQAVWSPVVTLVYKRTNKRRLNDRSVPVHERAATFDGPPHYSSESLVADSTRQRVDDLCAAIVKHFKDTEHKPITRLVAYFKVDQRDRLWVLWASSIRIARDRMNHSHLRVPLHLSMKVSSGDGGDGHTPRGRQAHMRELLDRDIALYELTGDWVFAAKCAGRREHAPQPPGQLVVSHGTKPDRLLLMTTTTTTTTSTAAASATTPRPPGTASDSGVSPGRFHHHSSTPRTPRGPVFISPRAPFLATAEPHRTVPIESARHPLHEAFVELHAADAKKTDADGAGRRTVVSARSGNGGDRMSRAMPKRLTEAERLREDLRVLAEDAVYLAYSSTLEITPTYAAKPVSVELPVALRAALSVDDFDRLVATMCLEPVEESDGMLFTVPSSALTRGRRHDRPVVQILHDVRAFFDDLFEHNETAIMTRWQEHIDSQANIAGD